MNSPPMSQNTQMATPINSLPLKTTQENNNDLDDPLIQNVLKEFEDEAHHNMPPPQIQESLPQQDYQQQQRRHNCRRTRCNYFVVTNCNRRPICYWRR